VTSLAAAYIILAAAGQPRHVEEITQRALAQIRARRLSRVANSPRVGNPQAEAGLPTF